MSIFNVILKLYLPLISFLIFLTIILKSKGSKTSGQFTLSFLGLFNTNLDIKKIIAYKIISATLLSLLIIGYYLLIDFTQFYPQKLKMTVHFDKKGLNEIYNDFGLKEVVSATCNSGIPSMASSSL